MWSLRRRGSLLQHFRTRSLHDCCQKSSRRHNELSGGRGIIEVRTNSSDNNVDSRGQNTSVRWDNMLGLHFLQLLDTQLAHRRDNSFLGLRGPNHHYTKCVLGVLEAREKEFVLQPAALPERGSVSKTASFGPFRRNWRCKRKELGECADSKVFIQLETPRKPQSSHPESRLKLTTYH
jgi:hypothetical protein